MKKRNKRQFGAWLMAMVLALNVFLPAGNIRAIAETTADKPVITIDTETPDHPSADTEISVASGSNADKEKMNPTDDDSSDIATGSNARQDKENAVPPAEPMPSMVSLSLPVTLDATGRDLKDLGLVNDLNITILDKKDGNELDQITNGDSFYIDGTFTAVAKADDPTGDWIKEGDYISWDLDDGIQNRPDVELRNKGNELVGILSFDPDGFGKATITFTDIFDDESVHAGEVTFGADLTYSGDNDAIPEEGKTIYILGETFKLMPKASPIVQSQVKSGDIEGDKIKWTVTVNVTQGSKKLSLKDYLFEDDLTGVGDYAGSFQINNSAATPVVTGNKLSYTFGDVSEAQIITFYTKIPESTMLGGDVKNTAKFGKPGELKDAPATVTVPTKTIITKKGLNSYNKDGIYNPNNETITWTITVDPQGIPMTGITVTDPVQNMTPSDPKMPALIFVNAKWEWADAVQSDITLPSTISAEPDNGKYALGNTVPLTQKVNLVITAKVPHNEYAASTGSYSNTAALTWDGYTTGAAAKSGSVGVGIDSLKKSVDKSGIDKAAHQIPWTITFNKESQTNFPTALKVYDLLIYGSSSPGTITVNDTMIDSILPNLEKQYNQKFASADGYILDSDYTVKPVMSGTTQVGDLLIVNIPDNTDKQSFTFKTQVLDPKIFAANGSTTVKNRAFLYSNTTSLDDGYADTSYDSSILSKSLQGDFDYVNKTATFRLDINKDGLDLTKSIIDGQGTTLGNITVTDTLPQGWQFVDYSGNVKFELHKAADDSLVSDTSDIFDAPPVFTDKSSTSDINSATFVFKKLDAQYYILVKAALPEARYQELLTAAYASSTPAASVSQTNHITMTSQNAPGWSPNGSANVSVNTNVLEKSSPTQVTDDGKWTGELNWTVKYNPYDFDFLNKDNIRIVDTLAEGLSMVWSPKSGLDYSTVTVTEYDGPASSFPGSGGTHLTGDALKAKLSYDGTERKLTFIPTPGKLYKLDYTTYVTNVNLPSVSNSVTLEADTKLNVNTDKSYSVSNQWGNAEMKFVGLVKITKEDNQGTKLKGTEFTLYDQDKVSTGITVTSDVTGMAQFAIPAPLTVNDGIYTFYLKETKAPDGGYIIDPTWHEISIKMYLKSAGKYRPFTTIDDPEFKNSPDTSNLLTVKNYLAADVGGLTIRKVVNGHDGNSSKEFTFHVTVNGAGSRNYPSDKGNIPFTQDQADISLKGGEEITISNLPSGAQYTVHEDEASLDHHVPSYTYTGQAQTISASEPRIVTVTNTRNETSISKRDATTGNELPGATLQLWSGETKVDEWISESTPHIIYNLKDGNYKLVEITAPNGYLTAEEVTFTITDGYTTPVVMFDSHKDEIVISKQDITNGKELPGASLELWKDGVKVDEWISANTPHIINYLEDGTYQLVEITAPKGYFTAEKVTFTVKDGKPDKQVTMFDKPIEIPISKQDITNGKELPGATLQLWKDGQKVSEWVSENTPHIVKYLEDGTYQLVEITAPKGYLTAEKITFIVKNGTTENPVIMMDRPYTPSSGGGGGGDNGGGPTVHPTPTQPAPTVPTDTTVPTPKPREEMTPQELYDIYGEVPQGYMVGPDNNIHIPQEIYDIWGQVPLGYMVGVNGQLVPLGLPKTGDSIPANVAIRVLFGFSILLSMFAFAAILRKDEETDL